MEDTIRRAKACEQAGVDAIFLAGADTRDEVAAAKAVYDTLKALRGGVPHADLRLNLATDEQMAQFTRRASYQQWTADFLSG